MTNHPQRLKALLSLPAHNGLPGVTDEQLRYLNERAPGVEWLVRPTEAELIRDLPDADIAAVYWFKREWLEWAGRLKLLSTPAAGKDWVEVRSRPGLVVVFGTFHGELMAETVAGMMLAFTRGIKASLDRQAGEPWARVEIANAMRPLRGSRVTILGFGHIGKWMGKMLKPFGVRLNGVNRRDVSRPDYFDMDDGVFAIAELDRLLPGTDHLVVVLPGGAESEKIIDARRLALLPRTAYIYNVGRGNAVDSPALVRALRAGELAGAGLDVYDVEPLPADHPIRSCPNVILMPHVSAFGPNYMDLYFRELAGKVAELFPGCAAKAD